MCFQFEKKKTQQHKFKCQSCKYLFCMTCKEKDLGKNVNIKAYISNDN